MRMLCWVTRLALSGAVVLVAAPCLHGQAKSAQSLVPAAILNAKTVFVSNGGSDGGLYPEPFSGDANRPYFEFVEQLEHLGKYQLALDPSQADLVMQIQLEAPTGPEHNSKQLGAADFLPFFKLTIFDCKTRFVLWTVTEPIEFAVLQKTHDKNFDTALAHLADDVKALSQPGAMSLYPNPPARQSAWAR